MATKTTVTLVDDLDGGAAEETIAFAVDGVEFEIDLGKKNAAHMRKALEPYLTAARRIGGRKRAPAVAPAKPGRAPATTTAGRDGSLTKDEKTALRTWARENGYQVADRGRIAAEVVQSWESAGRPM